MRILIADDDPVSRRVLTAALEKWGYALDAVGDGATAWEVLQQAETPAVAILDWMMPGLDGVEVCRRLRAMPHGQHTYVILLTTREATTDVVTGLEAGADDYVTKPFDRDELQARVRVGLRMAELQRSLTARVGELEQALANVKQLQGLLPICCYCKRIRDDGNYWQQVEEYLGAHSGTRFSHGICPPCFEKVMRDEFGGESTPLTPP